MVGDAGCAEVDGGGEEGHSAYDGCEAKSQTQQEYGLIEYSHDISSEPTLLQPQHKPIDGQHQGSQDHSQGRDDEYQKNSGPLSSDNSIDFEGN